jgi:hypothetical protein
MIKSEPTGLFHSIMEAYLTSKAFSRMSNYEFLSEQNPHFGIINLLQSIVLGPDALAIDTAFLLSETRALAMAPILDRK